MGSDQQTAATKQDTTPPSPNSSENPLQTLLKQSKTTVRYNYSYRSKQKKNIQIQPANHLYIYIYPLIPTNNRLKQVHHPWQAPSHPTHPASCTYRSGCRGRSLFSVGGTVWNIRRAGSEGLYVCYYRKNTLIWSPSSFRYIYIYLRPPDPSFFWLIKKKPVSSGKTRFLEIVIFCCTMLYYILLVRCF